MLQAIKQQGTIYSHALGILVISSPNKLIIHSGNKQEHLVRRAYRYGPNHKEDIWERGSTNDKHCANHPEDHQFVAR
jgi:hypothetical protein